MDDEFVLTILKTIDLFSELDNPPLIELAVYLKRRYTIRKRPYLRKTALAIQ